MRAARAPAAHARLTRLEPCGMTSSPAANQVPRCCSHSLLHPHQQDLCQAHMGWPSHDSPPAPAAAPGTRLLAARGGAQSQAPAPGPSAPRLLGPATSRVRCAAGAAATAHSLPCQSALRHGRGAQGDGQGLPTGHGSGASNADTQPCSSLYMPSIGERLRLMLVAPSSPF